MYASYHVIGKQIYQMRFTIFSHVPQYKKKEGIYAYGPYVREIDIWSKFVDQLVIVAPIKKIDSEIDLRYKKPDPEFKRLRELNFTSFKSAIVSVFNLPENFIKIFKEMYKADHIHIRCPGNIGLIALIFLVFFPNKKKTVKYAGNWDPESKQPLSYQFQKWILKNKFLARNTRVLIYGKWINQEDNIIPFFTASYSKSEKANSFKVFQPPHRFVFVGSLIKGKRPELAIKIIEELSNKNHKVCLDIYGDGILAQELKNYVELKNLANLIKFHGNQDGKVIKSAYKAAHFSILPSKSEGWPKALAEAMFFGCIPIGTEVSCIPWMLNFGNRGILIKPDLKLASNKIETLLIDEGKLKRMSEESMIWSQKYTLEKFEQEISDLI